MYNKQLGRDVEYLILETLENTFE